MPARILPFVFFAAALGCALPFVAAPSAARAEESPAAPPVVLMELFTSQSCYSCPPAEKLLAREYARPDGFLPVEFYADNWDDLILAHEYARRDEVMALELHVDYWDGVPYFLAGSWDDPFSQNAFTRRQHAYRRRIRPNANFVFTPEMIIQGAISASGAHRGQIDSAIAKAKDSAGDDIGWHFDDDGEGGLRAQVRGVLSPGGELYYAVFRRRAITEVPSGENKGKTLINTNVVLVLESRPLSAGRELSLPKLKDGEGCAVWLQNGTSGRVVAAARCPQQSS